MSVSQLSAAWPDPVKHDIAQFNLSQATIAIPTEYVETGIKTGKVEFTWRQMCAWLKPASRSALLSINGEQIITLPLSLVAPLFIKSNAGAQPKRKTHVDREIPDLFSAAGLMPQRAAAAEPPAAPEAAIAPPSTPPAALAPPKPTFAPPPRTPEPPPSAAPKVGARSLAELFNDPNKRTWTPNDIVTRAAELPGVAGALIALQDGLLVSACMPPTLRTETIAAFVPQIFGRLNQYTRELQLGDTRAISFSVESGTLQVFNAGIIYFAALGKPGALLPIPELQLIATELSRHTK
jgi:predicted regulator of Ras-like GTPase activity (Roadblock/LC7/MglB family)